MVDWRIATQETSDVAVPAGRVRDAGDNYFRPDGGLTFTTSYASVGTRRVDDSAARSLPRTCWLNFSEHVARFQHQQQNAADERSLTELRPPVDVEGAVAAVSNLDDYLQQAPPPPGSFTTSFPPYYSGAASYVHATPVATTSTFGPTHAFRTW